MKDERVSVEPIGRWGQKPLFPAKVGTGPSTLVLVKRKRTFKTGDRLDYCERRDVEGMCVGCTPRWRTGFVWDVREDMLFISR